MQTNSLSGHNGKRAFWFIAYTLMVVMMGTNVPAPLYDVYSRMWHFSSGMVTLLFAIYAIILVPSSLIFGQLSDQIGRKKVLAAGVIIAVIGTLLFATAHHTIVLLISRAIQGLSVGVLNGTAIATMAELRPNHRKTATLTASIAIALGTATGPLFSGILAQYAPFPIRLPYAVHLLLLIPAFVGALLTPETVQKSARLSRLHLPKVPDSILSSFLIASFAAVFAWAIAGFFMVIAPSFVTTLVGIHNLAVSGAVVFLMLGASTASQIAFKSLHHHLSINVGFALLFVGMFSVVISIPAHSLWLLLIATVVAGSGHGPAASGSLVLVGEIAPQDRRADVVSTYYGIAYLGVSLPVLGLGFLSEAIGVYHGILVFSIIMGIGLIIMSILVAAQIRREHRDNAQPDRSNPSLSRKSS